MPNFKITLRLLASLASYLLLTAILLVVPYIAPASNSDNKTLSIILFICIFVVGYSFSNKLVRLIWSGVDSVFAELYPEQEVEIVAQRLFYYIAALVFFAVVIVTHFISKDYSPLSFFIDVLFVIYCLNKLYNIVLNIKYLNKVREQGE